MSFFWQILEEVETKQDAHVSLSSAKIQKYWNGRHLQIKELNGTKVLVMPWVKPCSEEEMNNNPDIKEAIKNVIQRLDMNTMISIGVT